jgi:hypothetical protein
MREKMRRNSLTCSICSEVSTPGLRANLWRSKNKTALLLFVSKQISPYAHLPRDGDRIEAPIFVAFLSFVSTP